MKQYEVILKGCGYGWPGWLRYVVKAVSAQKAIESAKQQAAAHYQEYERFELQSVGEVRT